MTDLVPLSPTELEEAWAWNSPSPYWRVTKVQPVHQTGRHSINTFKMLLIEFTHEKKDKDRIIVEGYISNKEDLRRLGPFLDAAVELPKGIRIRAHTMEHVYWDNAKPRR